MKKAVAVAAVVSALTIIIRLAPVRAGENEAHAGSATSVDYVGTLLVQLRVSDLERSVAFYRDILGLKLKERNDALKWVKFYTGIEGVSIGIGEGPDVQGSGTTSINLGVASVDRARSWLESKGVTFTGETITISGVVKLADLTDPDGNHIRLAESPAKSK